MPGSSSLLRLVASWASVSQTSLKTSEGAAWMVHVASLRRSREDEVEDGRVDAMGCIGLFCPNFTIFFVLGHKGSLVINFPINRTPRAGEEASIQPSPSHPVAIVAF
jgi:hypothetical protein